MKYTQDFSDSIAKLRQALDNAETVVVGAGAGLSVSAGFTYAGQRFRDNFGDFEAEYGFRDMYSGGFYPYSSLEEFWAYWSRYILINRYSDPPKPVYRNLYALIKDKDYFVITTNVDHCFQKAGFEKEKLFYTQGDFGLFQCSVPCRNQTYDNEEIVRRMVLEQKNRKIPSELIPYCPICGKPMTMNLRTDDKFAEDVGWQTARKRYEAFLRKIKNRRVLFLELGVGGNTPSVIKYPFWRMTAQNPNATYACLNNGEAFCPPQIENQSVCVNADIGETLKTLL